MTKKSTQIKIYLGAPIDHESERRFLSFIVSWLDEKQTPSIVLANIELDGRQIDCIVATADSVSVVEVKTSRLPIRGDLNGTWMRLSASGEWKDYTNAATALFLVGGNPDLKPERASTWTASIVLRPASVPHLKVEGSVFHVRYRDRITQPISSYEGLLTNPAYAALVDLNPALGDVGTAVGNSKSGVENLTGLPYDPADVVAIIDSRYLNIARQTVSGIDIAADYRLEFASQDTVTLSGSASYIHSKQELTPNTAAIPAAGVIFNPPHWRARAGAVLDREAFTVSAYGNYIGGVTDNRSIPEQSVRPMTTVDLTAVYRTGDSAKALSNIEITLSVLNLFNDKPDRIKTSAPYYPAYDSTNYSVVGRFVSLSVTKHL